MKIKDYNKFEYGCLDTQELLTLYLTCSEELTFDERDGIEQHLAKCDCCREDYEGMKLVADVLVANRKYLRASGAFDSDEPRNQSLPEKSHDEAMDERFHDRMDRAIVRRKRRERKERIANIKRLIKPISAVAACLLVGLLGFLAANQLKVSSSSSPVASGQQQNSVKIEVISEGTEEIIPAGQIIVAEDGLKTLRINGNRQMILNVGSVLSVETYNLGCVVKLDKGEIYTEVEHDGKPFIVKTSHGRAVITGTTFNIKADHDKMDLAVVEGSVRYESEKGTVNVKGGYQSSIIADMKPSIPVICDAVQIAQWAKGLKANEIIPVNQPDVYFSEMLDLPVTFIPYCDLEDINFDRWIDQRREWFEREFPWTKRLQKLLAEDGIEVDTIDLLIESGDLCRFAWPEYNQQRYLAEDRQVVQEIASQYGVEIDKLISADVIQCKQTPNIEAFEKWLNAFKSEETNLAISSIHTCIFLINVRSLVWHAVNDGYISVENEQRVLDLLSEQVKVASNILVTLNQLLLADKDKSVCSMAQYEEYNKKRRDTISLMMEIEKELAGHEVFDQ